MRGQGGFALVITLIVTALLVALVTQFANEVYVETTSRQNFINGQQGGTLAESGITGGVKLLQFILQTQNYNSLTGPLGKPITVADEQGMLEVAIIDETSRLNLNSVTLPNGTFSDQYYPIAIRLLKKLGLPQDLGDSLADWVDENNEPHSSGAESTYYQTLKPPYQAKNGRLDTVDELKLVKGFDSRIVDKLRPFVTVYAEAPNAPATTININTAPREVLASLDERLTDDLVNRILDYRKTTPFQNPADITKVSGLETIGQALQLKTSVKSKIYRLISKATVKDTTQIIEAVVRVNGSQADCLYWREY